MARRSGSSLTECLIVLSVVARPFGGREEPQLRAEAQALAQWLDVRMTMACMEGVGFKLQAVRAGHNGGDVELLLSRPGEGGRPEVFRARRAVIKNEGAANLFTYSSRWHSLTPALTLYVCPRSGRSDIFYVVKVSGYGFISVAPGNSAG